MWQWLYTDISVCCIYVTAVMCELQWSEELCVFDSGLMKFPLFKCVKLWSCGVYCVHICGSNSEGGGNNDPTVQTHRRGSGSEEEVSVRPDHPVQQQQGQQKVSGPTYTAAVLTRSTASVLLPWSVGSTTGWQVSCNSLMPNPACRHTGWEN